MLILKVAPDVLFGYFRIPRLRPKLTIARNLLFSAIDNLGTEKTDTVFLDISVHVPLESWSYSGQSFTLSVEFEIVWSTRGVSQTALRLQPEARSDIATGVWSGSRSDVEGRPCLASNAGAERSSVIEQTPASTVSPPSTIQRRERHIVQSQASNVPQPYSPDSLLPSLQSATTVPVTAAAGVSVSTSQVDTELEDIGDTDKVDDTRPPLAGRYNDPYLRELIERIESLEKASYQFSGQVDPGSANHILDANTGLQRSHIILNKTRILSSSHWKTTTKELEPVLECYRQAVDPESRALIEDTEVRGLVTEMADLLHAGKNIAKRIKSTRPTGSLADPDFGLVSPTREVADQMTALYFSSFESCHRILHVPSFWAEYNRFWSMPGSVSTPSRLKVLLVVAIGSSLHEDRNPDAELRILVCQWIHAAQTWLSGPLKKDRLDLHGLQIYCLTILARQIFSIGGDLVWMSIGSLVHRAMQIGLHRDPKYLPPMSFLQAEMRRRLWATILEMCSQASLDAAMPPRISIDEFDTQPPSNVNDDELDETTKPPRSRPRSTYTSTSMQLQLLDTFPTRLKILKVLYGLHSEISYLDVLKMTSDILDACRTSDKFLRDNEKGGVTTFHRTLMDFLVRRFLLVLHCHFAVRGRTNPLFHYSIKVSIDAAMAVLYPGPDEKFNRLFTLGGGMFREGFRCAGSIISYELLAQTEIACRDGPLHRNLHNTDFLRKALEDMMETSAEKIREGETNIKSPMFLGQILAQVDAMNLGIDASLPIVKSGRDHLRVCIGLLQERMDAISVIHPENIVFTPTEIGDQDSLGLDFDLDFFLGDADYQ
ncbi:hypothetical protein E8E14_001445 [Neopestalotiopsis sp. 37M]|nr:hypothetical protein E8E14_001445 [Neopestalotiopsis sp. 37M]